MKHDRFTTAVLAALLGTALGSGVAGCWATAFGLETPEGVLLALWSLWALVWAGLLIPRRGLPAALGLTGLGLWLLWRRTRLTGQLLWLLRHISTFYDGAYGWGLLPLPETAEAGAFWPLAVLGALMTALGVWTVSRGLPAITVFSPTLLALAPCLVVTDTVPGPGDLLRVFFVLTLVLLSAGVRADSAYQGNRLTLLAALPTALALGLLFWAAPQEGYVNQAARFRERALTWFQELPASLSAPLDELPLSEGGDLAQSLDLAALGPRRDSTAPVMTVTADIGGTLYLRGQDYDAYDGLGWSATAHRVEELSCAGISLGHVTIRTRTVLDRLYLPYYPDGGQRLVGGQLENTALASGYTFTRLGLPDNWRQLALAQSAESGPWSGYLALPDGAQSLTQLAASLTQGLSSATEKAEAIAAYVRAHARYDKNTAAMPQDRTDFARWFLEEGETGYCVHFATATAVLLRAAGVPSRYVSGYMVRAQADRSVTVTGENAHAWAEYYEHALGTWLVMESTPAEGAAETAQAQTVPATQPAPELSEQPQPPQSEAPDAPQTQPTIPQEVPEQEPTGNAGPVLPVLLTILLAGAAALQRRVRLALRRRRLDRGGPNARALARWQEVARLARLLKRPAPPELEELALKAKYSRHTLTAEELARFDAWLRTARRELEKAPWHRRLVLRYIYALY